LTVSGALPVYLDGRPVVDVWIGWGRSSWQRTVGGQHRRDGVFSDRGIGFHGHPSACRPGIASYDVPVAEYWPEFGANGKSAITIRDMMRHRAGLSNLHRPSRPSPR